MMPAPFTCPALPLPRSAVFLVGLLRHETNYPIFSRSFTGPDPRTWSREDVVTFLRWCEREFDLPGLDLDKFQMNGTPSCL